MAKKARRKLEEEEEAKFEFPEFDVRAFVTHEFEQYYATLIAFGFGVLLGLLVYLIGLAKLPVEVPVLAGVAGTVAAVLAIREMRPASWDYTKGDWASLVVLVFFSFLGVWLLLADVLPATLG